MAWKWEIDEGSELPLCACGCGVTVSGKWSGSQRQPARFVHGHNRRGHRLDEAQRQEIADNVRGEKHGLWKGDGASYSAIHRWRKRNRSKTGTCDKCGVSDKPTDWANVSGEYRREDESDWLELCRSCHIRLDRSRKRERSAA